MYLVIPVDRDESSNTEIRLHPQLRLVSDYGGVNDTGKESHTRLIVLSIL